MNCKCRVCKRTFCYDDDTGYDKELCGPMCDGVEAGRRSACLEIERMRELAGRIVEALDFPADTMHAINLANQIRKP